MALLTKMIPQEKHPHHFSPWFLALQFLRSYTGTYPLQVSQSVSTCSVSYLSSASWPAGPACSETETRLCSAPQCRCHVQRNVPLWGSGFGRSGPGPRPGTLPIHVFLRYDHNTDTRAPDGQPRGLSDPITCWDKSTRMHMRFHAVSRAETRRRMQNVQRTQRDSCSSSLTSACRFLATSWCFQMLMCSQLIAYCVLLWGSHDRGDFVFPSVSLHAAEKHSVPNVPVQHLPNHFRPQLRLQSSHYMLNVRAGLVLALKCDADVPGLSLARYLDCILLQK